MSVAENRTPGWQQTEVGQNVTWFDGNTGYMAVQESLPYYRYIRLMVTRELAGQGEVLDIGNGGFFNYDTQLAAHVTAVDLFLQEGPGPTPNSSFRRGSILELPFDSNRFDCILLQNVLHHVTGRRVRENYRNLDRSMAEIARCLRPGGKAVLIESTVGGLFLQLEKLLYPIVLHVKRGGHPVTFQFTPEDLLAEAGHRGLNLVEYCDVPSRGMVLLQMGYRWPALLTPARAVKLVWRKPEVEGIGNR
jgi:SAM-dependent methyltransferase